jgi:hypothetical protein
MDVPRPTVPSERLAGWEEIDATVEEAFSTPVVTVYTHTVVYEEATERARIHDETGVNLPWRFFFSSRIRLDPQKRPSKLLTPLVRRKAAAGFTERLATRGFEQVSERRREEAPIGDADGLRVEYRGVIRHEVDTEAGSPAVLTLPVAAMLGVWAADDDYHVAGGGYPAGHPDSGPAAITDAVSEHIDPTAAKETLETLIDSCGASR